jgi:hypothetical protein
MSTCNVGMEAGGGGDTRHKSNGLITITVTFIATLRVIISSPIFLPHCCHIHHSCALTSVEHNHSYMNQRASIRQVTLTVRSQCLYDTRF